MKKRILYPPLRDTFTKFGDKFEKIAHNEANGMYCYKRTTSTGTVFFEVFRAPKVKGEDGNTYERYPKSSEFGFGRALCITGDRWASGKIRWYMRHGFDAGRYR